MENLVRFEPTIFKFESRYFIPYSTISFCLFVAILNILDTLDIEVLVPYAQRLINSKVLAL